MEQPELIDREDHPFFVAFSDRDDVEVKVLPSALSSLIPYHFMVMDNDCYRFEDDKTKHAAVASFGDPVGGKKLASIFEDLWKVGESLSPIASKPAV